MTTTTSRASGRGTGGTTRATATRTTHTRVLVLNTTLLSVVRSGRDISVLGSIDTNRDPGKDTLRHIITQEHVLHERVDGVGLLGQDAVIRVGGQLLRVGGVRRDLLDGRDQVLVEEELADVRGLGGVQVVQGVVGLGLGFIGGVGQDWRG